MRWLTLFGAGLLVVGTLASAPKAPANTPSATLQWRPIVSPGTELFPALLIATANLTREAHAPGSRILGDPNGLVGVTVAATGDGQRARVRVSAPGLGRTSSIDVVLARAGDWYQIYPVMQWDFARLHGMRRATPETLEFTLELDGHVTSRRSLRVRVRAVNDAPYSIDSDGSRTDLSWMFAAYVDEEHPLVQRILGEALKAGYVERFDGYQSGDPEQVYRQVFAIWQVLARRGIRYSSITRTAAASDAVLSQYVRFLDESWNNRQANCVDGAVLLASVLRRIDIDPQLILVPGHMFLGFALDHRGEQLAFLETTRLGAVAADTGSARLLANFEAAVEEGLARHDDVVDKLGRDESPEYRVVDIASARRLGVAPIAVR